MRIPSLILATLVVSSFNSLYAQEPQVPGEARAARIEKREGKRIDRLQEQEKKCEGEACKKFLKRRERRIERRSDRREDRVENRIERREDRRK